MDKKRQMKFNLNNFLLSISRPLDFIKYELEGVSLNHSKRVAYIALNIALRYNFSTKELSDLCSYCLIHSIALIETKEYTKEYYDRCNQLALEFPFLDVKKDTLKYQSEFYDGSGFFGLKGEQIPIFSQLLSFSINLDIYFDFSKEDIKNREDIISFVNENRNKLFSDEICDIFIENSKNISFWLDLQNENDILYYIFSNMEEFTQVLDLEEILQLSSIFTELYDGDVEILDITHKMLLYYQFDYRDIFTFLIAISLKNIGKFMIRKDLLYKKVPLDKKEYEEIKAYPYHTKKILSNIMGFKDISILASKSQEKIDMSGYPFGCIAKDLSFKDRLYININIYDALLRNRNDRKAFSHNEAIGIMKKTRGLDMSIVHDLSLLIK